MENRNSEKKAMNINEKTQPAGAGVLKIS